MSSSRQSPLPPPQSPLLVLGEEKLKTQLHLEEQLRLTGEELLEAYKNSRQWKQVSQLAQSLGSNSERITCIQDCLSSIDVFELPPYSTSTPPAPVDPPSSLDESLEQPTISPIIQAETDAVERMVEDPYDDYISIKLLEERNVEDGDSPYWEIKSTQYTNGITVVRTSKDVSLLLQHINNKVSQISDKNGALSADSLRETLRISLQDSVDRDQSLLYCFLSPKVNSFSSIALGTECKYN